MRAILTYHSIDPSGSPVSCDPETFDRHARWLGSGRVTVTTIEDLVALPPAADALAITFDDGFVNLKESAVPRLIAYGLPSTVFVVADSAGRTNAWNGRPDRGIPHLPLLDWDALAKLQQHGVTLGSHGRTHRDLTRLAGGAVEDELRGSIEIMERQVGNRPTLFAYPYGRADASVAAVVARSFRYGCTTEFRTLDGPVRPASLPRLDAYYLQRPGLLEAWGTPEFEQLVRWRQRLRRLRRAAGAVATRLPGFGDAR
jgi:peptidoglycan/xylan/chitin deacetylase (PgdA/CDA1 family)